MDASRITELPALLRSLADDITTLPNFADLPEIANVRVLWDDDAQSLKLSAQYAHALNDDLTQIADLNAWAAALGGVLLLGDEVATPAYYWRSLTATAALPGGLRVEIWTHLHYQIPTGAINAATRLLATA
jgi:hypothetical protein